MNQTENSKSNLNLTNGKLLFLCMLDTLNEKFEVISKQSWQTKLIEDFNKTLNNSEIKGITDYKTTIYEITNEYLDGYDTFAEHRKFKPRALKYCGFVDENAFLAKRDENLQKFHFEYVLDLLLKFEFTNPKKFFEKWPTKKNKTPKHDKEVTEVLAQLEGNYAVYFVRPTEQGLIKYKMRINNDIVEFKTLNNHVYSTSIYFSKSENILSITFSCEHKFHFLLNIHVQYKFTIPKPFVFYASQAASYSSHFAWAGMEIVHPVSENFEDIKIWEPCLKENIDPNDEVSHLFYKYFLESTQPKTIFQDNIDSSLTKERFKNYVKNNNKFEFKQNELLVPAISTEFADILNKLKGNYSVYFISSSIKSLVKCVCKIENDKILYKTPDNNIFISKSIEFNAIYYSLHVIFNCDNRRC